MCIRDSGIPIAIIENKKSGVDISKAIAQLSRYQKPEYAPGLFIYCLLYTSDAADERSSVDLGGRRIIKKKKTVSKC